jgi:GAF domain-containing protein
MNHNKTDIEELAEELQALLGACSDLAEKIAVTVSFLARVYGVADDEIALFLLDDRRTVLHFLWPERLKQVGFIPFSSGDSLAARTAREERVFLTNTFASQQHASFFEKIRLKEGTRERPLPIQKNISVPMVVDGQVKGVIQVSRKGLTDSAGLPDFSDEDAARLLQLAVVTGRHL